MPRRAVIPRDVTADQAARRVGLDRAGFDHHLPRLLQRGFPLPDETTGLYDLDAIDRWCDRRHPHLFPALTAPHASPEAVVDMTDRLARIGTRCRA